MKFSSNISILNSLIRITCGFTLLAFAIAKFSRKPWRTSYLIVAMLAGMKIGEGILRYCPIVDLMEQQKDKDEKKESFLPELKQPTDY